MVQCIALNCKIRSGEKVSMYLFPKDPKLFKQWVHNVKRWRYEPSKYAKVCERHFTGDQFKMHPDIARACGYTRFELKPDAVPTVFDLSDPNPLKRPKASDENQPVKKKAPRRSKAAIKRQALQTLKSLYDDGDDQFPVDTDFELRADNFESMETEPENDHSLHSAISQTDTASSMDFMCNSKSEESFEAFTQTPYNLVQRRTIAVQVDIPLEEIKPTVRDIEIQTDIINVIEEEESFLSICESERDDPDWIPFDDSTAGNSVNSESETSPSKERKFIVFETALDSLFQFCRLCGSRHNVSKSTKGSMVTYSTQCECGNTSTWNSQPQSGTMPLGNLLVAAAIMFSGSSPVKSLNMFRHACIEMFTVRTYNNIQSAYLVPAVESVWKSQQLTLITRLQNSDQPVVMGGDARCCSPGHTAKYGSYSLMDLTNSKIIDIQLVQSNEVKNSYCMELEGLKRCLAYMLENDVCISQLITDRHSQVKAYMKNQRPEIEHYFDCWHVAKGIYKKLEKKGKQKSCEIILDWARSISNHLYWCAASSDGNGELVLQKWQSILNHVTDVHEGHGDQFQKCAHGQLDDRAWIRKGSSAYRELGKIVNGRMLVKDVQKLSPKQQTSGLEAFHKVVCHFAPKAVHFFHSQMEARLFLAALHFNENSMRPQAYTKDGSPMYTISYPKSRKGEGVAKEVKEQQTFKYIDELMEEVEILRELHSSYSRARQMRSLERSRPIPLSHSTPHRPKQDIINSHVSRFNC